MPVPNQPNDPGNNGDPNNGNGSGNGDGGQGGNPDPNNPAGNGGGDGGGSGDGNIDLKALSADQLQQVLENPNLWNLPRVKELRDQAAEAKRLKDEQTAAENKRLEDNKEFEQLAESRKTELETANATIKNMRIDQALTSKLVAEGVVDLDAALKLADRDKVSIDDNGVAGGVDDVVSSLKTDRAYLFNKTEGNDPNLGSPSNPGNGNGGDAGGAVKKFKRSQLSDPKFYQENREDILKAMKAGLIEDDITPHQ